MLGGTIRGRRANESAGYWRIGVFTALGGPDTLAAPEEGGN